MKSFYFHINEKKYIILKNYDKRIIKSYKIK